MNTDLMKRLIRHHVERHNAILVENVKSVTVRIVDDRHEWIVHYLNRGVKGCYVLSDETVRELERRMMTHLRIGVV